MSWSIFFFKNQRGDEIVKSEIKKFQTSTIAKIIHHIDLLQEKSPLLPMPYSKKISGKIYELRIRGKQEVRICYTCVGKNIYLLYVFLKKSQKIPKKEIVIAQKRKTLLTRI